MVPLAELSMCISTSRGSILSILPKGSFCVKFAVLIRLCALVDKSEANLITALQL